MPSVCIHVRKAYSESEEIAIMNAVHAALVTAFGVEPETRTSLSWLISRIDSCARLIVTTRSAIPTSRLSATRVERSRRSAASTRRSLTTSKRLGFRETAVSSSYTNCHPKTLPFVAGIR